VSIQQTPGGGKNAGQGKPVQRNRFVHAFSILIKGSVADGQDAPAKSRPGTKRRWAVFIPALGILGILVVLIYVSQLPANLRWKAFGTAVAVAGAAALVGGIVGFLFGIPLTNKRRSAAAADDSQYEPNTNLEEVSDWLTKIIVGVGLVQVGRAMPALDRLGKSLNDPLGGKPYGGAFGLGLTIFYALLGFLFLYLWSRQVLLLQLLQGVPALVQKELNEQLPGATQKELDKSDSIQSHALSLVNTQLNSAKGGDPPTQDELDKAVAAAPGSTRFDIFGLAERARMLNRLLPPVIPNAPGTANRLALVARTIPVFKALIAADTEDQYHRNHGCLGWALIDQYLPGDVSRQTWQEARDELTKAIEIRDRRGIAGWRLYEANRALCNIHLFRDPRPGDPSPAELTASIDGDLAAAQNDDYAKNMLDGPQENPDIRAWRDPSVP
jgi:hypothetical protein